MSPQVEAAFKRCVFNVVFNNRDDHAKNFSLRMNQSMECKLSPAYDLTFNVGPRGNHQTSVMGESLHPGREHLLKLAESSDISKATATRIIDTVLEDAPLLLYGLRHRAIRRETASTIISVIKQNMMRCLNGSARKGHATEHTTRRST